MVTQCQAAGDVPIPLTNLYKDETGGECPICATIKPETLFYLPFFVGSLSNGTGQVLSTILIPFNCFFNSDFLNALNFGL